MRFHLQVRNEFEYVRAKPLGGGFTGVAVKDFRFAVLRPFADGRNESVNESVHSRDTQVKPQRLSHYPKKPRCSSALWE
jgi:hypothetical protein